MMDSGLFLECCGEELDIKTKGGCRCCWTARFGPVNPESLAVDHQAFRDTTQLPPSRRRISSKETQWQKRKTIAAD